MMCVDTITDGEARALPIDAVTAAILYTSQNSAQQALQLFQLGLKRPVFGSRNDLLFGGSRRQCALGR